MDKKVILTIGRQYGSGGHAIGEILSRDLGIRLWDKDILQQTAEHTGMSETVIRKYDEKPTNSFLYSLVMGLQSDQSILAGYNVPLSEQAALAQFDTIREIAEEDSAIFVGRCADYALRECEGCLRLFIYAPIEDRIARACERLDVDEKTARSTIEKTDKRRASYYSHYTLQKWGDMNNYDFCINSSLLGITGTADLIKDLIERRS